MRSRVSTSLVGAALLLLGGLFWLVAPACAGVFSWTDDSGQVHYSDTPVAGAQRHDSGTVNTMSVPMSIPFRQAAGGVMVVEGKVAGIPMLFVVDTGASFVTIPPTVASQAGVSTQGATRIPLNTANGRVEAPLVEIDEITAGDVSRQHIQAVIHEIMADKPVGLLGMSFLSGYRVTVDHEHSILVLEPR